MVDDDYKLIHTLLCSQKRGEKWTKWSIDELKVMFQSAEKLSNEVKGQEMHELVNFLNIKLRTEGKPIKQSLRKPEKVNQICLALGYNTQIPVPPIRRKIKPVKSLQSLCISELSKKSYPKEVIAVAYAECAWPIHAGNWYEKSHVANEVTVIGREKQDGDDDEEVFTYVPVYTPEFVPERQQLEVRVMDGTHMRTNIKAKLIRSGLGRIKISSWKNVASSGKTDLAPAMLEVQNDGKIMHQQSDAYVRTMFSMDVEKELDRNGDHSASYFCKVVREWHEAEDMPGLQAFERCRRSIMMRDWLLKDVSFNIFPPPTQYIQGIPRVTFEGLVCSIDAHLLLYSMVKGGTYNWRSVSTLVAENFMGELAERAQNNHGVPSGKTIHHDMTKISELHAMRMKPNRSFQMKTAKSRAYTIQKPTLAEDVDMVDTSTPEPQRISTIYVRNHEFDKRAEKENMGECPWQTKYQKACGLFASTTKLTNHGYYHHYVLDCQMECSAEVLHKHNVPVSGKIKSKISRTVFMKCSLGLIELHVRGY